MQQLYPSTPIFSNSTINSSSVLRARKKIWIIGKLLLTISLSCMLSGGFSQNVPAAINVGSAETYTSLTGATGLFKFLNDNVWTNDVTVTINSDLQETGVVALNAPIPMAIP
jgi:hypothetical protein